MTLHPLTKELLSARFEYSPHRDEAIDRMVRAWADKQAEWFKKDFPLLNVIIDQAFQLAPQTLEEKFEAIRLKHNILYPSAEFFWAALYKDFIEAAEEHFNVQPPPKEVKSER